MKIGFDSKRAVQNNTGLGNYSRYVIEAVATYGNEEQVVLYAPKSCGQSKISSILEHFDNVEMSFPNTFVQKCAGSIWRTWGITRCLNRQRVDVYHGLSNELPLNIRKFKGKTVVTVHDLIFLKFPRYYPFFDRAIYHVKFRSACRKADCVIAVSECTKRDIVSNYGIHPDKVKVIYQGCDSQFGRICSLGNLEEIRRRYHLPQQYLLNIGTIEERKNALTIVKAMLYLPQDLHLVLVGGEKDYAKQIHRFANLHHLEKRVHILNDARFEDFPALYQGAQTFVYPSVYEGFGIPILEALNSGVPVVAATGSCLEEAGGPQSLYVNPYQEKDLAKAISETFVPEKRAEMIKSGRQWAARFSMQQMAAQTLELYQQLASNKS